jgi:hypothetical protein
MLRLMLSIPCGGIITFVLLVIGFKIRSETVGCILLWNFCLLVDVFKPGLESHLTGFLFMFSGLPIYSLVAYYVLGKLKLPGISNGEQIVGRERRGRVSQHDSSDDG